MCSLVSNKMNSACQKLTSSIFCNCGAIFDSTRQFALRRVRVNENCAKIHKNTIFGYNVHDAKQITTKYKYIKKKCVCENAFVWVSCAHARSCMPITTITLLHITKISFANTHINIRNNMLVAAHSHNSTFNYVSRDAPPNR